jgi:hypothetical protein
MEGATRTSGGFFGFTDHPFYKGMAKAVRLRVELCRWRDRRQPSVVFFAFNGSSFL